MNANQFLAINLPPASTVLEVSPVVAMWDTPEPDSRAWVNKISNKKARVDNKLTFFNKLTLNNRKYAKPRMLGSFYAKLTNCFKNGKSYVKINATFPAKMEQNQ